MALPPHVLAMGAHSNAGMSAINHLTMENSWRK